MFNIYRIEGNDPKLVRKGYFSNGIVYINDKEIKMTKEDVLKRFSRGYWRCGII